MDESEEILGYITIRNSVVSITRESDEKDAKLTRKVVACRRCNLVIEPFNLSEQKLAEIIDQHGERCDGQLEHFYSEN